MGIGTTKAPVLAQSIFKEGMVNPMEIKRDINNAVEKLKGPRLSSRKVGWDGCYPEWNRITVYILFRGSMRRYINSMGGQLKNRLDHHPFEICGSSVNKRKVFPPCADVCRKY